MVQLYPWVSVPSTNSYWVASSSQVLCRVHRHSWEPAGHAVPGPVEFTVGQGFVPGGSAVWNLPAGQEDAGDVGSIPGWGRSPGGGHSNPFQYSCWDNPMDRGTWWAIVHGVTRSWSDAMTQLSTSRHWGLSTLSLPFSCSVLGYIFWDLIIYVKAFMVISIKYLHKQPITKGTILCSSLPRCHCQPDAARWEFSIPLVECWRP